MNIVVLCAGSSTEREVSIVTGTQVCKALREKGHNARVLDVFFGDKNRETFFDGGYDLEAACALIQSDTERVAAELNQRKQFVGENVFAICEAADVVFMALHGSNGEDGRLQAAFDLMGIRYTGSGYLGSALAMDKGMTKHLLTANHIPTPNGILLHKHQENVLSAEPLQAAGIGFPCVVKPCCGGSSIGISILKNEKEYKEALEKAFGYEDEVLVEAYVKGREFSIGVVGHKAYPIIEIIPLEGFYDYENKYQPGRTKDICPAPLKEELTGKMQEYAVRASEVLRLNRYSRIDFMMDENENIYCIEANTLPGMTPTSLLPQEAAALGIDFGELCEILIRES